MAAKRLTIGQNGIRDRSKPFILGIQKLKRDANWTSRSWDITDFLFHTANVTSETAIFSKMAANRLTMGQKSIRGLLMVFILGIEKFKHDGNWTARSWDTAEYELWDEYSLASYSIHAAILKLDFRGFPVSQYCQILDISVSIYFRVENRLQSFCCNFV